MLCNIAGGGKLFESDAKRLLIGWPKANTVCGEEGSGEMMKNVLCGNIGAACTLERTLSLSPCVNVKVTTKNKVI